MDYYIIYTNVRINSVTIIIDRLIDWMFNGTPTPNFPFKTVSSSYYREYKKL